MLSLKNKKKTALERQIEEKFEILLSPLQRDLLAMLERNGPMTRADIVKLIAKPRTTVFDNLMGLIHLTIVKRYARPTNSRGRPLVFFKVREDL